jgi:ribosomal protein L7Ae-like RNA K-turn-binding protein
MQKRQIVVHRGFASDVAKQFNQGELDFLYIGGDHTYKGVSADIECYCEKLKIDSVLIADDYSLGGWWGDGVVGAVHDALSTRQCIVVFALGNQIVLKRIG